MIVSKISSSSMEKIPVIIFTISRIMPYILFVKESSMPACCTSLKIPPMVS